MTRTVYSDLTNVELADELAAVLPEIRDVACPGGFRDLLVEAVQRFATTYAIARMDDWGAVYVNGLKEYEGHDPEDFLAHRICPSRAAYKHGDEQRNRGIRRGIFPHALSELRFDDERDEYTDAWLNATF